MVLQAQLSLLAVEPLLLMQSGITLSAHVLLDASQKSPVFAVQAVLPQIQLSGLATVPILLSHTGAIIVVTPAEAVAFHSHLLYGDMGKYQTQLLPGVSQSFCALPRHSEFT